jgi:hypothetical protein
MRFGAREAETVMIKALFYTMLDRLGVIRQKTTSIPLLDPTSQFARDIAATEAAHDRHHGIGRHIETNTEMLR